MPSSRLRTAIRWAPALALLVATLAAAVVTPVEAADRVQGKARATSKARARIELGRRLFFDPQVSQSGLRSCASCHAPDHGFSDPDRGSTDDTGITPRHSQTIVDAAYNPSAHWDGEFSSVEELVTRRLSSPVRYYGAPTTPRPRPRRPVTTVAGRPGAPIPLPAGLDRPRRRFLRSSFPAANGLPSVVVDRLNRTKRYDEAFRSAFGNEKVTLERLALAIAAFSYSVESTESQYDRYKKGDKDALSSAARRGLVLFEGRAGCFECHSSKGRHALFTDYRFHNTGVAWHDAMDSMSTDGLKEKRRKLEARFAHDPARLSAALVQLMDAGRLRFSQNPAEARAFKTPTLRDVALRGPYMHDGRFETLEEVVRYYAKGCGDDPCKSEHLKAFQATDEDVADLVAFLEALSGNTRPGLAERAWTRRARKTKLTFLRDGGQPMAGLKVELIPVGDPQPLEGDGGDEVLALTTDKNGALTYVPGARTHMRIRLPDEGLHVKDGALVPDTCRSATIQLPATGRVTFIVTMDKGAQPPPVIVAEHVGSGTPPVLPKTVFKRTDVSDTTRAKVVWYEGWLRPNLSRKVMLRLPGLDRVRREMVLPDPFLTSPGAETGATRQIDLTTD